MLNIFTRPMIVGHSGKNSDGEANKNFICAVLKLGDHEYTSNWVVANCRYDVLLGMP